VDVLVVGAGPTGLTLAAMLQANGARARIVDQSPEPARESRALVVHARTLEALDTLGLAEPLVRRGIQGIRGHLHGRRRVFAQLHLGDTGAADTAYPFVVFVSQAETEAVLGDHLAARGTRVERPVELLDLAVDEAGAACVLRGEDGVEEVRARYVVGCDGAHSAVRHLAGIAFPGDAYPQQFLLGDVDIAGDLEPHALHIFVVGAGLMVVFPLGSPRPWRVICTAGRSDGPLEAGSSPASLAELQAAADTFSAERLALGDPLWLARFRFHHRQAERYRAGPVFLAGDAAHIHSPAGGQGMNTGMQDAWNLAWKLALVLRGAAPDALLDSYHAERWPVGRFLLQFTDRLFEAGSSTTPFARLVRAQVVPRVAPLVLATPGRRRNVFRTMSQLRIAYPDSPVVEEERPPAGGPRAGERLPDARVAGPGGEQGWLLRALRPVGFHLLLCGDGPWDEAAVAAVCQRAGGLLRVQRLAREGGPGRLADPEGAVLASLGAGDGVPAQYLVRPDGHVAFRQAGAELDRLARYVGRWLRAG
jgi:2-polyprenyl-6-methoxyphenol hydroxylase-like FAD-dependent oxidoreductase